MVREAPASRTIRTTAPAADKEPPMHTEPNPADGALALDLDRAHVFHSWSAQGSLNPFTIAGASGTEVWDFDGKHYLDFSSQLVNMNIGHTHPKVVAAIQEQAALLPSVAPAHANLVRGEAAHRILAKAGPEFGKVFFTNGGADANENAIRMARLTTGRDKVLSTYRSYHGNTGAAVVATGDWRRVPNEFARGHVHFFGPYLYRSEFWATTPEEESARALWAEEGGHAPTGPEPAPWSEASRSPRSSWEMRGHTSDSMMT